MSAEPTTEETTAPEIADAIVTESRLNDEQIARVEALTISRSLLTGENVPVGAIAIFAGQRTPVSLGTNFVSDLTFLSEYVLNGVPAEVEEPRGFSFGGITLVCADPNCGHGDEPEDETEESEGHGQPAASHDDLVRHAQKQGVSYADAYSYFEDQGYDVSGLDQYGDVDVDFDVDRPRMED